MPKINKRKTKNKSIILNKITDKEHPVSTEDFSRLEFHRNAVALMPNPADRRPGIAIRVEAPNGRLDHQSCSCITAKSRTCSHLKELSRVIPAFQKELGDTSLAEDFKSGIWYRLANIMADGCRETLETIRLRSVRNKRNKALDVLNSRGEPILTYFSQGCDRSRFLERCTTAPEDTDVPTRGMVMQRLSLLTITENEMTLLQQGLKTRRQALEENFWYKFAYHGYREYASGDCTFHAAIEETTGAFVVTGLKADGQNIFSMEVPRQKVKRMLNGFQQILNNHNGLNIHPIPLDSIFSIKLNDDLDLEILPQLRLMRKNGVFKFFEREDLARYQYGDLIYIKELGILAEDQYPKAPPAKFKEPVKTVIEKSQVPIFLEEFQKDLESDVFLVDETIKRLKIFKHFDQVEISPEAIDRDWCWLSVKYGTGSQSVSLAEILRARQKGQRFIGTDGGWVDCQSPDFDPLGQIFDMAPVDPSAESSDHIKLARSAIFRIFASDEKKLSLTGDKDRVDGLKKLLDLKPSIPLPEAKGMTSALRAYQMRGTEWLWFLFENRFGGLLCDDMGLGKTHQVMALMLCLMDQGKVTRPFLVVSPTTVISHWHKKIREHAPALKTVVYYGDQRDLQASLDECNVLLTSYGILRRDADKFKDVSFTIAVFDEIQHVKNPETQSYKAAESITAQIKIGLTGTPIENTLSELKALMDLTVPGYLGPSQKFYDRYIQPIEENINISRRKELSRLISPFTLRRLKKSVLTELPDKIEDIRTCRLSEDQVKLYRDAISSRAAGLLEVLANAEEPLPYIHI
ncbi:MAG: DEAD/DEAH box helicase, partial [Proteobacteria bacterium]|nr:DEAD/DEAH box helicase [Pseudomonadota bacterium]